MAKISEGLAKKPYDETVETKFAETRWPRYVTYELRGAVGSRYVLAPSLVDGRRNEVREYIDPFSRDHAALFLKFARWSDSHKMEGAKDADLCGLDTERNAQAALAWAREYGLLGLGTVAGSSHAVAGGLFGSASEIAAGRLGMPHLGFPGTRAYRMRAEGGGHETVEAFVLEAEEANVVLKLYEAVTAKNPDVGLIERFMPDTNPTDDFVSRRYRRRRATVRELFSGDAESAKSWGSGVIQNAVNQKVETGVYPLLYGEPNAYTEGWGFKSLLGAMWFQMRRLMLGDGDHCLRCGRLFDKRRRDHTYCGDTCSSRARAARAYARKKQRQQEASEATRRRLRR